MAKPYLVGLRRLFTVRRTAISSLAGIAALACLFSAVPVASADPEPVPTTSAELTTQLAKLAQQNEQLTEQYNAAQIAVTEAAAAAEAAKADADAALASYKATKAQLKNTLAEEYKGSSFNRTAALLTSDSGAQYIGQLNALSRLNIHRGAVLEQLATAKNQADQAKSRSDKALAQVTEQRDDLKAQKADLDAKQRAYRAKLAALTPVQRAAYTAAVAPVASPAEVEALPAPSGAAAIAVQTALAQQGKPYVYSGGGPNSFDCSGLTSFAWAAAGVKLPHNAAAQYSYGTRVPLNALEPGDLVFYYSPIGHVGLYVGNGLIVHAPTSGDVVRTAGVNSSGTPVGATRLT